MSAPYRVRAELSVNGGERKLVFACIENETPDHLALKLAAYLAFWDEDLTLDARHNHPALEGQEFYPDLLGTTPDGTVSHWVECGTTAMHKLGKVVKRWPQARISLFKETEAQGRHLRGELERNIPERHERIAIYVWPGRSFRDWAGLMTERLSVVGEAAAPSFNLVVNEHIYATDLLKF